MNIDVNLKELDKMSNEDLAKSYSETTPLRLSVVLRLLKRKVEKVDKKDKK